jgi:hypothetical protein
MNPTNQTNPMSGGEGWDFLLQKKNKEKKMNEDEKIHTVKPRTRGTRDFGH